MVCSKCTNVARKSELSLLLRDGAQLIDPLLLLFHIDVLLDVHPQAGQLLEGLAAGVGEAQQLFRYLRLLLVRVTEAGIPAQKVKKKLQKRKDQIQTADICRMYDSTSTFVKM